MKKCPGSGTVQMLSWFPTTDYPGAVVCNHCTFGVLVLKHSVREATSGTGQSGKAGKVRVHYISADGEVMSYRMRPND